MKIFDEIDKLSNMDTYDIIKFVTTKNELVGEDCVHLFTIDEVS